MSNDQGFSLKVDRATGAVIKKLAEEDDRTVKSVVARAIARYANLPREKR